MLRVSVVKGLATGGKSDSAFGFKTPTTFEIIERGCYSPDKEWVRGNLMSVEEHKAKGKRSINCFVVTVSDTRDESTDQSGQLIKSLLVGEQHQLAGYRIVKDEPGQIETLLRQALADETVEAIIVNGGTGISPRDGTYEVIAGLLDKRLDGFGEIFRYLSYQDIGSAALMSRAVAGSAQGKVLISLPGSKGAVSLAMEKLILPELRHMVSQLQGK
jgi:molybdenum cofactor biosynthesis protein B